MIKISDLNHYDLNRPTLVVSLVHWNLARDILMTLAIKRVHTCRDVNLTLVMFLDYLTLHKTGNVPLTHWSRGSLTLETVFLNVSSTEPLTNMAACLCKCKGMSPWTSTVMWSSHTTGSFQNHFRHTITGFIRHSNYWEEDTRASEQGEQGQRLAAPPTFGVLEQCSPVSLAMWQTDSDDYLLAPQPACCRHCYLI